jgi:hypothetical protein
MFIRWEVVWEVVWLGRRATVRILLVSPTSTQNAQSFSTRNTAWSNLSVCKHWRILEHIRNNNKSIQFVNICSSIKRNKHKQISEYSSGSVDRYSDRYKSGYGQISFCLFTVGAYLIWLPRMKTWSNCLTDPSRPVQLSGALSWTFIQSSASINFPRNNRPFVVSREIICPIDSCNNFIGTPTDIF